MSPKMISSYIDIISSMRKRCEITSLTSALKRGVSPAIMLESKFERQPIHQTEHDKPLEFYESIERKNIDGNSNDTAAGEGL